MKEYIGPGEEEKEEEKKDTEENKKAKIKYIWHCNNLETTCDKCAELHGHEFAKMDHVPNRPHPNCKCVVRKAEVGKNEKGEDEENEIGRNEPQDWEPKEKPKKKSDKKKDKKQREVSKKLIEFLKGEEGSVVNPETGLHMPYLCEANKPTIGYGHVMTEDEKKKYKGGITEEQAQELLKQDLSKATKDTLDLFDRELTKEELDALTSLIYNVGKDEVKDTRTEYIIENNLDKSSKNKILEEEYLEFSLIGDKRNKGLVDRRKRELDIMKNGEYNSLRL